MTKIKVGNEFKNNVGSGFVVLERVNEKALLIEFTDTHRHKKWVSTTQIRSGLIKNPFTPRLFGVGYFGVGKYKAKDGSASKGYQANKEYRAWVNMLSRCYDDNYVNSNSYTKVQVCNSWHNFQTFAEWYSKELKLYTFDDKPCLDKDLIGDGLLYSAENCCIIPNKLNSILAKNVKARGTLLPQGVLYKSVSGAIYFYSRLDQPKDIRLFFSEIEASARYKTQKLESIREFSEILEGFVNPSVVESLRTKDFDYLLND